MLLKALPAFTSISSLPSQLQKRPLSGVVPVSEILMRCVCIEQFINIIIIIIINRFYLQKLDTIIYS